MSKIIDITDKLNFEERPIFKIKDTEVEANNDAVTMLKVVALFDDEGNVKTSDIITLFDMLFDEENQQKIKNLKLSLDDFTTFIFEVTRSLQGGEDDEGEAQTPATT